MTRRFTFHKSSAFNAAGWLCFALAVKSFLGIGYTEDDFEMLALSIIFPIPDFETLFFAGCAILFGFLARKTSTDKPRGSRVIVCSLLCAVLTFTPLSYIPLGMVIHEASVMNAEDQERRTPDGYEPLSEEHYTLYAFLGSGDSMPSDVDVWDYSSGYDGHAKGVYDTYKVTGWLYQGSGETFGRETAWYAVETAFRLVDADGNDILSDGEPVILRYEDNSLMSTQERREAHPEGNRDSFQTNTVRAEDLSGTPYGFVVESVQRSYYIDQTDGSKHYTPVYH